MVYSSPSDEQPLNCSSEAGFSLLELMIVVAIVGVAVMLALPDMLRSSAQSRLKQQAQELRTNMSMARMAAVNRNTTVTVSMAIVGGVVEASFGGILPVQRMHPEIKSFGGPTQIRFNSYGMLAGVATNQTITLTNSQGVTQAVQVTPGGKVRWCQTATCT